MFVPLLEPTIDMYVCALNKMLLLYVSCTVGYEAILVKKKKAIVCVCGGGGEEGMLPALQTADL